MPEALAKRMVPLQVVETSHVVGECMTLFNRSFRTGTHDSCGESGHMARQCPTAPEGSGNDGKCFNCGEEGYATSLSFFLLLLTCT